MHVFGCTAREQGHRGFWARWGPLVSRSVAATGQSARGSSPLHSAARQSAVPGAANHTKLSTSPCADVVCCCALSARVYERSVAGGARAARTAAVDAARPGKLSRSPKPHKALQVRTDDTRACNTRHARPRLGGSVRNAAVPAPARQTRCDAALAPKRACSHQGTLVASLTPHRLLCALPMRTRARAELTTVKRLPKIHGTERRTPQTWALQQNCLLCASLL